MAQRAALDTAQTARLKRARLELSRSTRARLGLDDTTPEGVSQAKSAFPSRSTRPKGAPRARHGPRASLALRTRPKGARAQHGQRAALDTAQRARLKTARLELFRSDTHTHTRTHTRASHLASIGGVGSARELRPGRGRRRPARHWRRTSVFRSCINFDQSD